MPIHNLMAAQKAHADCMSALKTIGDYDASSPMLGLIGELWAEINIGMKKAPPGATHIDGWHPNGDSIQVKAKRAGAHADAATYVTIPKGTKASLLFIVFVEDDGSVSRTIGPVETSLLEPRGRDNRCYISDIERSIRNSSQSR